MGVLGYEPLESQLSDGCGAPPKRPIADLGAGVVESIAAGSPAERAGLRPGDRILSVNGEPIRDAIDLMFHASEHRLDLRYEPSGAKGANGKVPVRRLTIRREGWEELGVALRDFKIRMCNNQCVFCFIHQNPPGLRKGIYFKDGDYRMSFMHGNYVTTTNMKEEDFERIIGQRLTPMYVSVHTTNHELRLRMLGVKKSTNVLENLKRLKRGKIQFHTQIVLCPGWNDGLELERTIRDLAALRPALLSIAIVPLGMTDHREGLPKMQAVTPSFCKEVIAQIEPIQKKLKAQEGEPILFLADEFYITANKRAPSYADSEVLHQLENGVGMVWEFMLPWRSVARRLPARIEKPRSVAILTGMLGARVLRPVVERLSHVDRLHVDLVPCVNGLFGRSITVSGLLSGRDFLRSIAENPGYDQYLIPGNAIRAEGEVFLDDMTLAELKRTCGGKVRALEGNCGNLAGAVLGERE